VTVFRFFPGRVPLQVPDAFVSVTLVEDHGLEDMRLIIVTREVVIEANEYR